MQKNNAITKRKIMLLTFTLLLIFSLATITFSWYRNYVEVIGPEMTTGHINVNMNTYYVNNFEIKDTKTKTIDSSTIGNITLDSNIETFTPDGNVHMYYFFHNPGTTNSIDLEVMLAMNIEGLYTNYEVDKIGGVNITLDNETADFKDWVTQKYTNDPVLTADRFEQFIKDSSVSHSGGDTRNFLELDKAIISGAVKKEDVLCIRVTVTLNEAITIAHLNKTYPVRMSLCVAQEGGLPGQEKITTYYASTLSSLNAALNLYKPNDKIIITSDIDYVGDLIFNRPVNIVIQESTLNVHGNLMFSYSYPGSFSLNTAQSGKVCVYRINNAGGDFEVTLPNASIELIGKNSTLSGQADIYVQRNIKINASESVGVVFTSSRICETSGIGVYSTTLKDISIGDHTRIEVGSRTEIGNLFSEVDSVIRVRNNGTINTINLQLMSKDTSYVSSPNIFIDNYSVINNILLPEWSSKFNVTINEDTGEDLYSGNTRIVSNTGSSSMNIQCAGEFKSDGSKNPETDDVEYVRMNQFVEVVNGNKSDVIVHYTITEIEELVAAGTDNTLKGIMEYYNSAAGGNIINSPSEIKKLKIICYSGSFMSNADYTFIKTMSQLSYLDMSDAVSEGYKTIDYAFQNMKQLTFVEMSEVDTTWGTNNFQNTGVIEVKIPSSVTTLSANALTNLKYIHTDYTMIATVASFATKAGQYVFTPDQTTKDAYLTSAGANGNGKIFIEASRYSGKLGDYFFRVNDDNKTFEFVTMTLGTYDIFIQSTSDYMFNLDTITLNNEQYKLTSIDDYAFYKKAFANSEGDVNLVFGDKLTNVGDYAFNGTSGIKKLKFLGPTRIGNYVFQNLGSLIRFEGEFVPYVGTYAFGNSPIYYFYAPSMTECGDHFTQNNKVLKIMEIGMISDPSTQILGSCTLNTMIVHTDTAMEPEDYTALCNMHAAPSTLIINEEYSGLWVAKYGNNVVQISGNVKTDIIRASDDNYPEYLYYKNENSELSLLKVYLTEIDGKNSDFIIPSVSKIDGSLVNAKNDENAYPLVELSKAVYKNVSFKNINTLSFPDSLKIIGSEAFHGTNKVYNYLDLNQVTNVGEMAFYGNTMVKIDAPKVTNCNKNAFQLCSNLYMALLPKLHSTTGSIFPSNTNLRYLLLGPCDVAMSGTSAYGATQKIRLIMVDAEDATDITKPTLTTDASPTLIVGNSTSTATDTVIDSFDKVYYTDFYTVTVIANNVEHSFEVPSYVYYSNSKNQIVLGMAISDINDEDYIIPSQIYPTGENVDFLGKTVQKYTTTKPNNIDENSTKYVATRIGDYSFKYITYNAASNVVLGDNFLNIGISAFGSTNFYSVDVKNVTVLENSAFSGSKIYKFIGNNVEDMYEHSLAYTTNLETVNLPSIVNLYNKGAFRGSNVKEVILGENLASVGNNVFENNTYLTDIYMLSLVPTVANSSTFVYSTSVDVNKLIFHVPSHRIEYYKKWSGGTNLVKTNIIGFENSYTEESTGLLYLWSSLGDNNIKIESVAGLDDSLGISSLEIPSSIVIDEVTYSITKVDAYFYTSLSGASYITEIKLPDNLEVFEGDNSLLAGTGITSIAISEENGKYETVDGVLYSKGKKVLMLYPIGKQSSSFIVPEEVETIYQYAFMGNMYLQNVTFPNSITLLDGAFKECTSLQNVIFENSIPSVFIGKDIFTSNGSGLVIYIPTGTRDEYISSIIFDLDIMDIIQENTQE